MLLWPLCLPILLGAFTYFLANMADKRSAARYASERPRWIKAIDCWNRLYFCHRDGVVFDPETREKCDPRSIGQLLYPG